MDKQVVIADFKRAGFVLNVLVSLRSQQLGRWLGFIIGLIKGNFHIPDQDKVQDLKSTIRQAYTCTLYIQPRVPVKCLASVAGKIILMTLAIRLRTRA